MKEHESGGCYRRWHPGRTTAGLLLLALLLTPLALLASATSPLAGAARADAVLIEQARHSPDARVEVIVRYESANENASGEIAALGGEVTHDLRLIDAVAAVLPARAVPELARADGVRWISANDQVMDAGKRGGGCSACIDTSDLISVYVQSIGASRLWNQAPYLQGQGVTVAVVDSGIKALHDDLSEAGRGNTPYRTIANAKFNSFTNTMNDDYGHGTHVAGIIGGNGKESRGAQIGVAPKVNLVNVKVSDDRGAGTTADVVAGLQWVYDHRDTYNIRVVNISLNGSVARPYHESPINAAAEILWFNGIVVVVSAGNNGVSDNGILYPPANDPFVITVGAADDRGTVDVGDDILAPFSAYGTTGEGYSKPEIVAPGTNIISLLASNSAELVRGHPDHRVDGFAGGKDYYFRMSGTSMAAAVTSGAAALLIQDEPSLTPDQVKYRLMTSARPFPYGNGAGYLDIEAAVHGTTTASANTGIPASQLLWSGGNPVQWNSVNWGSVNWGSVNWGSVNWGSVNWGSVNWGSVSWGQ